MYISSCVIIDPSFILYVGFENIALSVCCDTLEIFPCWGEKTVLRRNVFAMEGHGKGKGVPCFNVGDREHNKVTKLKGFNMDGGCQYVE
jgi:hypothetical protein